MVIRGRSRRRSLVQLPPAGIRVKGVPCGDNFVRGPEEAQMDLMLKKRFSGSIPISKGGSTASSCRRSLSMAQDMPPANAALWCERFPDSRLVMVKECRHLPHVERATTSDRVLVVKRGVSNMGFCSSRTPLLRKAVFFDFYRSS